MHELSIAQSIISIAENAAPKDHSTHITSVGLQIGELSGIEIESLKFALSVIKKLDKEFGNISQKITFLLSFV